MEVSTATSLQNEDFWKHQHELLQSSGMKRSDYCQKNNLNYDRFGYWISRWNRLKKDTEAVGLVGVKLKSNEVSEQKILCTLELKNGNCLKIHDAEAFRLLLTRCC